MEPIYGKLNLLRGDIEGTKPRVERGYDDEGGRYTLFGCSSCGISLKGVKNDWCYVYTSYRNAIYRVFRSCKCRYRVFSSCCETSFGGFVRDRDWALVTLGTQLCT